MQGELNPLHNKLYKSGTCLKGIGSRVLNSPLYYNVTVTVLPRAGLDQFLVHFLTCYTHLSSLYEEMIRSIFRCLPMDKTRSNRAAQRLGSNKTCYACNECI